MVLDSDRIPSPMKRTGLMTYGKIPWLALAIVALLWAAQGCSTQEPEKSKGSVLDYSQPVYTVDHAVVCPLGTLIASHLNPPADRGPEAIAALYISPVDRGTREKASAAGNGAEESKYKLWN